MPNQTALDSTFHALADPTRRAVLAALADGPRAASDLASPFDMALPSFLQHLKVLEDSALIATEKQGRRRVCRLRPETFAATADWMAAERARWEGLLDRLGDWLDRTAAPDTHSERTKE
ncbi:ArsR/SmtB family transcription factor [Wenxinia marina]|uniref:Transcriptional regulator, ArsR family n=1 Tax=Wenxinia marina DSM 24838 TaxID=1123501 RepID=A0A0D0Q908_9RHOB|nr:metalloregulator ArsR/SmtB family transcription factor [Wenxinia marina]KIQ67573.1 transcriptional regulator, ArsR family [Wenxinia marina DSM 24838]GGL68384.1 hypothetical protein GCM10011392_23580 [Wenxinia marina]